MLELKQNTENTAKKKAIITFFLSKNIIVNTNVLARLNNEEIVSQLFEVVTQTDTNNTEIQNKLSSFLNNTQNGVQSNTQNIIPLNTNNQTITVQEEKKVKIIFDYEEKNKKRTVQDFVGLFHSRFKILEKILHSRKELQNLSTINRISYKKNEIVSIIGLVMDKQTTKNENISLTLEDETGTIKAIITKTKPDIYTLAKDLVLDEVIGISGSTGENVIFTKSIVFPDIPLVNEIKKSQDEANAIVLSDLHIGSTLFLEEEFKRFISWIRGETGTEEQKMIAKKVKYIFIAGDLVDGVGIYPNQEKELKIKDVYKQYAEFTRYIQQIPSNIQIIISSGNHDAVRLAEPQPKVGKELCPELWQLPNITFVGNPSIVNIHASSEFPGFDVLFYHGYSYDYYGDVVESIRNAGRHISDRNDMIMKFLLQKRHLAPTYTSTLYMPDPTQDPLVIEKIPDFFLSGHVHKSSIGAYRGVQIISGSCWQAKTPFQEKVGHEPEPCRVPIIDLKTRQVKMLRFDNQTQTTQAEQTEQANTQQTTPEIQTKQELQIKQEVQTKIEGTK